MKFFVAHDDCSEGTFADIASNSRFLTQEEFEKLESYPFDDSRSQFTSYVHSPKEATICEINDLSELKKVLERYSQKHTWGSLVGFWDAPLGCDGYIVLDINFD